MTIHHFLFSSAFLLHLSSAIHCQQGDTLIAPEDTVLIYTEKFFPVPDTGFPDPVTIKEEADTIFTAADTVRVSTTGDSMFVAADTLPASSAVDSSNVHSPRKASIYSAVLPGLGQIYNRKYWKVPIVYIGFGVCAGSTIYNIRNYNHYKKKYIYMLENDLPEYNGQSINEVKWYKNTHRRYRDLWAIISVGFYALQIIDASVDAHLFDFDVSDEISFSVDPVLNPFEPGTCSLGLSCCLYF